MVNVTVDPLTRIEGHLRLSTEVNSDGIITDAQSSCLMFRGFERILQNQDPRDAALLVQRICGVCPTSHSLAAAGALDQLFGVAESVPKDALVARNINQALNTIASHATHIYVLWGPDLANPAYRDVLTPLGETGSAVWKELLGRFAPISYKLDGVPVPVGSSYLAAIPEKKRLQEAIAVIGGKMPHQVTSYPGGYTYKPTIADIGKLSSYYLQVMDFVSKYTLRVSFEDWIENTYKASSPQKAVSFVLEHLQGLVDKTAGSNNFTREVGWGDAEFYAAFGSELVGETLLGLPASLKHDRNGGYSDPSKIAFLAYGAFYKPENGDGYDPNSPAGDRFQTSGIVTGNLEYQNFDASKITESVAHSFFEDSGDLHPSKGETFPVTSPEEISYEGGSDSRYSWSKAPRYGGVPCEVGPLARLLAMKEPLVTGLALAFAENGYSAANTYTRMMARIQETAIIANELLKWVTVDYDPNGKIAVHTDLSMAKDSQGMGLWEAPRGALGHWVSTDSNSKVISYQPVVPSTWNLSPRDSAGVPGPLEQALIGSKISAAENALGVDYANPVNILHIGRSYDPCSACAVHTIDLTGKNTPRTLRIV
ncbi:F420-nonreducing hydrogenase [Methanosarcina sp. KYL-1]|uniref:nickel-dependent hydrogenase large subunit n=1 Tax=Methanosarcina sp. KYL-1 TaxID=2602068 RepID=UPI0021014F74|nr:nickel-dependent hydrogenase large subunit [Methanosarcina sp. KYL-1]MCQ1534997.1 F420-nonreducing hydrogenase [Methanosarcina sp. KYL-1]